MTTTEPLRGALTNLPETALEPRPSFRKTTCTNIILARSVPESTVLRSNPQQLTEQGGAPLETSGSRAGRRIGVPGVVYPTVYDTSAQRESVTSLRGAKRDVVSERDGDADAEKTAP